MRGLETVAIVDDDKLQRETAAAYMREHGLDVLEYPAIPPLEVVTHDIIPDVVILDAQLRDTGGTDTVDAAASVWSCPFVVWTGHQRQGIEIITLSHGVDEVLIKPVNMPDLIRACERAYYRRVGHDRRVGQGINAAADQIQSWGSKVGQNVERLVEILLSPDESNV